MSKEAENDRIPACFYTQESYRLRRTEKNGEKQMEENNGIKIKTYAIYSIMSLVVLGMVAYMNASTVKTLIVNIKIGDKTEMWESIFFIFLFHLIFLFLTFDSINI